MKKTLIVTLEYNAPGLIKQLAKSLVATLPENGWHWFVRDNSTKDDSEAVIKEINDPRITIKRFANEGTFASQHNELMKEGLFDGYDFLLLLNNDTIAQNDFLTPMLNIIARDGDVGAVGATLIYPNGSLQHAGIVISGDGQAFNVSTYLIQKAGLFQGLPLHDREYQGVTGACLLMRVEDYKRLNGMDEEFHWCFDDVDLCLRINQELRKKCVVSSKAILTHIENYTTLKNPSNLKPSFQNAHKRLKEKHAGQLRSDIGDYRLDIGRYRIS